MAEEIRRGIKRLYDERVVMPLFGEGKVRDELLSGLERVLSGVILPSETVVCEPPQLDMPIDYDRMYNNVSRPGNFAEGLVKNVKRTLNFQGIKTYRDLVNYFQSPDSYNEEGDHRIRVPNISGGASHILEMGCADSVILYRHLHSLGIELFDGGYTTEELRDAQYDPLLDSSVSILDLTVRTENCFAHAKIKTIRELVGMTPQQLIYTEKVGKINLAMIKRELAKEGLYLKGEKVPS